MKELIEKYLTGSSIKSYIEDPNTALTQNQIDLIKAKEEAETSPIAIGLDTATYLSSIASDSFKNEIKNVLPMILGLGGKVDKRLVEVEGGEVAEDPLGNLKKYIGKKHEQGGIKTVEEVGTEIYSDRLKIDGKSFAERKIEREKKLNKFLKLLEKSNNSVNKKTFEHVKKQIDSEEEKDKKLQELANLIYKKNNYAYGTSDPIGYENWKKKFEMSEASKYFEPNQQLYDLLFQKNKVIDNLEPKMVVKYDNSKNLGEITNQMTKNLQIKENTLPKFETDLTLGDNIGIGGQLISSLASYYNTLKERANDIPNINYFKEYGEEGLKKMDNLKNYLRQIYELEKKNLNTERESVLYGNRNNTRSLNTLRSLNLFTDSKIKNYETKLFSEYLNQTSGIDEKIAELLNDQDKIVMEGEKVKDIADRKDKSNYYTQLNSSLHNLGLGFQNIGKTLNQVKYRTETLSDINDFVNNSANTQKLLEILNLLSFNTSNTEGDE